MVAVAVRAAAGDATTNMDNNETVARASMRRNDPMVRHPVSHDP
nr:hypothetical protein GCM10020093_025150 [Planobispora longispora]